MRRNIISFLSDKGQAVPKNLKQWLLDLETRHATVIQLGLERVRTVAQRLDLCQPKCPVITVAGTNGKGSTVKALETIYHCAGYTVGAYTSPHLLAFNERICVHQQPVTDQSLCDAFEIIDGARVDTALSYFEFATLAALYYFRQQKVDVIILEVGLGGRLDATNIIDADLAIITTIDYDHQEYLGDTLEAIGAEKAGILRAKKPFIYADLNPPQSILQIGASLAASSYLYEKNYFIERTDMHWKLSTSTQSVCDLPIPKIQLKSAAAAIMACQLLHHKLPVTHDVFKQAMRSVFVPGRLELCSTLKEGVNVLYDVSHNPQSTRLLAKTIKEAQSDARRRVHAVFSALKDKDIVNMLRPLKHVVDLWYVALLETARAADSDYLLTICKKEDILVNFCYNDPLVAFDAAFNNATKGDLIVVFGSFFTVAQVRGLYEIGH